MIPLLPKWCLTNRLPAFYDLESATAIEQTGKLYGAMQSMIEDYNKFASEFNKTFEDYVNGLNQDHECFQNSITKLVHDYIAMLDEKLKMQDKEIEDTIVYIKENMAQYLEDTIREMNENDELNDVIANAFDNLGGRVITLENSVNNTLIPKVETLEQKTETLEQKTETLEQKTETLETTLNNIKAVILYDDSQATSGTTGEITLSENVTNFDFIEVYAERWGQTYYAKSDTKVGRLIQFCSSRSADGSTFQHALFEYKLNEQSITPQNNYMYNLKTQNSSQLSDIHITKVIGYKLYK